MIRNRDRDEVIDHLLKCSLGSSCLCLSAFGYVAKSRNGFNDYKNWLDSEYIEKYKLTENEVIELKYMFNVHGLIQLEFGCVCGGWSRLQDGDLFMCVNKYENLNKSKTYSIEEILSNYEVVE